MNKIIYILGCVLLFSPLFGFELDDLSDIKRDNIKGEWTQSKKLVGFEREIKSQGNFMLEDKNLFWFVRKPINSDIKINNDGIFIKQNDKWIKSTKDYDKSLFLDVINLDFPNLNENFKIEANGSRNSWNLILSPKGILIKKIFNKIEISGGDNVKEFILYERSGDITHNIFYNVQDIEK